MKVVVNLLLLLSLLIFNPVPSSLTFECNILQWNCRSISKTNQHLIHFLATSPINYNFICLQSLATEENKLPFINGFTYPPNVSNSEGRVQTATYVSTKIKCKHVPSPMPNVPQYFFSTTVQTKINGHTTNIVNLYYPQGYKPAYNSLHSYEWLASLPTTESWIVVGDFNVRNKLWEDHCPLPSHQGAHRLINSINNSNLLLLNDGSKTRYPHRHTDTASAIDLTLASPNLLLNQQWYPHSDCLLSDHKPITIQLCVPIEQNNSNIPAKKNYDKANWTLFQSILSKFSTNSLYDQNLETHYNNIRQAILQASDAAVPTLSPNGAKRPNSKPWWNDAVCIAIKQRKKACTNFDINPTEHNHILKKQAEKQSEAAIKQAKRDYFNNEQIVNFTDLGKAWKRLGRLKNNGKFREPRVYDKNNKITTSASETAEVLAETFAKASQTSSLSPQEQDRRQGQQYPGKSSDNSHFINAPLKHAEVVEAIMSIKKVKKATGGDPISYQLIKKLPPTFTTILSDFYSRCWTMGEVPQAWRHAEVVGIHKPGKPARNPASFRPISLTPHLGKVYERIVKARLEYYLEKNNIIPQFQAGFRKHRSCMEQVVKLASHVRRAFARKKITYATFFDIKGAYDSVWHGRLLKKLHDLGIEGNLYNFILAFLQNRTMHVRVGSSLSRVHRLDMGVPQGSIIAPILFNIMLHDISKLPLSDTNISMYADDIAIWSSPIPRKSQQASKYLLSHQSNTNRITEYLLDNGFTLSPDKCEFMVFARTKTSNRVLSILNTIKEPVSSYKFLGVIFSFNLHWKRHIEHIVQKAAKSLNFIKSIACQGWAREPRFLVHLVQTLVRSRLTYGMEAFYTIPTYLLKLLERLEMKALKVALGVPRYAINRFVYRDVGWLPLDYTIQLKAASLLANMYANSNLPYTEFQSQHEDDYPEQRPHQQTCMSIYSYVQPLLTIAGLALSEITHRPSCFVPRWEWVTPSFDLSLHLHFSKSHNPNLIKVAALEKIYSHKSHLQIYTDGSKLSDSQIGCSFYIPGLKVQKYFRLNSHISIFSAELWAILEALSYINNLPNPPISMVIYTDSLSSLMALQGNPSNRTELLLEIRFLLHQIIIKGTFIIFAWIPSHCGIPGNDQADRGAKSAATGISGGRVNIGLSIREAKAVFKQALYRGWAVELKEYTATRSQDHNIVKGGLFLGVPRSISSRIYRLRTYSPYCKYRNIQCQCGIKLTQEHIFQPCSFIQKEIQEYLDKLKAKNMTHASDSVLCGAGGDWSPLVWLAEALGRSYLGHLI